MIDITVFACETGRTPMPSFNPWLPRIRALAVSNAAGPVDARLPFDRLTGSRDLAIG